MNGKAKEPAKSKGISKLIKKVFVWVRRKFWHIILLSVSSVYVWQHRFNIYQLSELNVHNLIFILWLILLMLPLFSEMEFLGVKIKKEVEKATGEVKESLHDIQMQVSQLQLTNSVANHINFSYGPLPTQEKIQESLGIVWDMQRMTKDEDLHSTELVPDDKDKSVFLFKVRLGIETKLREICEKIEPSERMPISKMLQLLSRNELISSTENQIIREVIQIANHGVHGEIVSDEYIDFVKATYPEIIQRLKYCSNHLKSNY